MKKKTHDTHEAKPKILIVDDDPNERKSLVIGFNMEKLEAHGAPNGPTALRMLEEKEYSVALIDLMMPDMNGLQLARVLRSVYPSVITVLMSAYHLSPVQLARANAGVVGFVPKPFRFDSLVKFISSKIEGRRQRERLQMDAAVASGPIQLPIEIPDVMSDRDIDLTKP